MNRHESDIPEDAMLVRVKRVVEDGEICLLHTWQWKAPGENNLFHRAEEWLAFSGEEGKEDEAIAKICDRYDWVREGDVLMEHADYKGLDIAYHIH